MRESEPSLERLTPRRGRGLPPVAVTIAAVALIAFSIGFAFGGRGAAEASSSPSPPPALAGASVSSELRTAYLKVAGGGWAVCSIANAVTCEPELAIPRSSRLRQPQPGARGPRTAGGLGESHRMDGRCSIKVTPGTP